MWVKRVFLLAQRGAEPWEGLQSRYVGLGLHELHEHELCVEQKLPLSPQWPQAACCRRALPHLPGVQDPALYSGRHRAASLPLCLLLRPQGQQHPSFPCSGGRREARELAVPEEQGASTAMFLQAGSGCSGSALPLPYLPAQVCTAPGAQQEARQVGATVCLQLGTLGAGRDGREPSPASTTKRRAAPVEVPSWGSQTLTHPHTPECKEGRKHAAVCRERG